MHVIFRDNLHDEAWLEANSVGWQQLRERAAAYHPERVAAITGLSAETIVAFAREYATTTPAVIKTADGVQRHQNGGQTFRSIVCLPALTGQYGKRGGGLSYSTGGYATWNAEAIGHAAACPPSPRSVNMNRLGAALTGEVSDPPIMALYVYNSNPVTSSPNAGKIVAGLQRDDLFTVVHELFMTDTARYADIILPATSQLEQVDLHRAYGHRYLQYNQPAIAPLAECKSNWDVSRLLAAGMGYQEPWLHESAEDALRGIIDASRAENPFLAGVTLERLQAEGTVSVTLTDANRVPFSDLRFPTPSGKVELFSSKMQQLGLDPLPEYVEPEEFRRHPVSEGWLHVISGAAHHFVTSSMANQPSLLRKEGEPYIEIAAADAVTRGISTGDTVLVENARGSCRLRAIVSADVTSGTASAPKGFWGNLSRDGRNINWTTSDALADLAGQSTFHSNAVRVSRVAEAAD
jgi:anaerobic selenocysteine-containing dehydrogenase